MTWFFFNILTFRQNCTLNLETVRELLGIDLSIALVFELFTWCIFIQIFHFYSVIKNIDTMVDIYE